MYLWQVKTKKKYGQHFLINTGIKEKINDSIKSLVPEGSNVLEVGPGQGVLTKYLLDENYNLKVVEIDEDMVTILNRDLPNLKPNQIILGDMIRMPIDTFFGEEKFFLVGNFPYNVSSQLLVKMFEHHQRIPGMVGMFQKEVADRVVAKPGSKTYGILSVLVQCYFNCKRLFLVSKGSFNPPPKVESAVIRVERNDVVELPCSKKLFKRVVKATFNQRRKMMRNTLKELVQDSDLLKEDIFTKRPEQLSVDDFIHITQLIEKEIS